MFIMRIIWDMKVSKRCGNVCATRFNINKFYVLPTQCIYVFDMDIRTNGDYFPITETRRVYCTGRTKCLNIIQVSLSP
jgi:hypothetical protein